MLIGLLSDSHGKYAAVRSAVSLFDRLGVDLIIHCGDVGDVGVLEELAGHNCRFVWGNMDDPAPSVDTYLDTLGLPHALTPGAEIDIDGKQLRVFHGHEPAFHDALRKSVADYIVHGHTHMARDEHINKTRVINPGALHRANPKSVATLDTSTDTLHFHEISGNA